MYHFSANTTWKVKGNENSDEEVVMAKHKCKTGIVKRGQNLTGTARDIYFQQELEEHFLQYFLYSVSGYEP